MHIEGLFPIPLGYTNIKRDFTLDELNTFKSLREDVIENAGNTFTKNTFVLELEQLAEIKQYILTESNNFFQNVYCPITDVKIRITQSWINYAKKGQWHHKHNHPNSFISGVLYLNAVEGLDKISFISPVENSSWWSTSTREINAFNNFFKKHYVKNGDLLIFPSSLVHLVEPVDHDDVRVSLAFNTFLDGELGRPESLNYLNLGKL